MSYPNSPNQFQNQQLRAHFLPHETNPTRRGQIHPVAAAVLVLNPNLLNGAMLVEAISLKSLFYLHTNSNIPAKPLTGTKPERRKSHEGHENLEKHAKPICMNLATAWLSPKGAK